MQGAPVSRVTSGTEAGLHVYGGSDKTFIRARHDACGAVCVDLPWKSNLRSLRVRIAGPETALVVRGSWPSLAVVDQNNLHV